MEQKIVTLTYKKICNDMSHTEMTSTKSSIHTDRNRLGTVVFSLKHRGGLKRVHTWRSVWRPVCKLMQSIWPLIGRSLADCISMVLTVRVDFTKYYYYYYLFIIYYLLFLSLFIYYLFTYYIFTYYLFIIYYLFIYLLLINYLLFIYLLLFIIYIYIY